MSNLDEQQDEVISFWLNVKSKLSSINFFKKESSITTGIDNINEMSIIVTRVYVILLVFCVLILLFFNALHETRISNTINNPSLVQFEQLYEQYSSSLLCPCESIAIPYKSFLSVTTTIHQVKFLMK